MERTFTVELESQDDLDAIMGVLDGAGVLNGIERPVSIRAEVIITTEAES